MQQYCFTNLYYILRWPAGCLIFLYFSCSSNSNYHSISPAEALADSLHSIQRNQRANEQIRLYKDSIQTGDLIVRTGNDFTSESLRSLNQHDKTYSHCGIASLEHDTLFVYHALGGDFNPDQKIRRDPYEEFAAPTTNRGIGIYRYDLTAADTGSLMTTVKQLYHLGIMFDMKFDLATNDRMYCAEFVYKSFIMGTKGKLPFSTSHIGNFEFVGVDDLYLLPSCHLIKKILYE